MDQNTPAYRDAQLLAPALDVERRADGTVILRSPTPLIAHDFNMARAFAAVAARQPDAPALHQRAPGQGEWRTTSYGELKRACDGVTQWLIDQGISGPVMMMGANTPAMAAFLFGTLASGLPAAPVSPQLAMLGGDLGRLRHVMGLIRPKALFVEDARLLAALDGLDLGDCRVVTADPSAVGRPATALSEALAVPAGPAVDEAIAALTPDGVAQYMLTSGSTGLPKAVRVTLANLAANTASGAQLTRLNWTEKVLNWMPWHHAAGAAVLRAALLNGGEFYIDDGKPLPGLFDMSLRNLKEIPVPYYVNVPLGYALLAEALEADAALRRTFFSELRLMLFGGAALSQPVHDRIQAMAMAETGKRIVMVSAYGATETTSGVLASRGMGDGVSLGLPLPGTVVKLVPEGQRPEGQRHEIRIAGASVTPGYLDDEARTRAAFDEEGFYRTGDLAVFVDPADPERGLVFAGRLAEEFKLDTGAWVSGGEMREEALRALSPLVTEVVLCDDNRPYLAVMAWPSADGVQAAMGQPLAEAMQSGRLAQALSERLTAHNAGGQGRSRRIERLILLTTPPNPNAHEVSDKGSINRRAVIDNRAETLDALYADPPGPGVVTG